MGETTIFTLTGVPDPSRIQSTGLCQVKAIQTQEGLDGFFTFRWGEL
jgi:hypothetical protein